MRTREEGGRDAETPSAHPVQLVRPGAAESILSLQHGVGNAVVARFMAEEHGGTELAEPASGHPPGTRPPRALEDAAATLQRDQARTRLGFGRAHVEHGAMQLATAREMVSTFLVHATAGAGPPEIRDSQLAAARMAVIGQLSIAATQLGMGPDARLPACPDAALSPAGIAAAEALDSITAETVVNAENVWPGRVEAIGIGGQKRAAALAAAIGRASGRVTAALRTASRHEA